MVLVKERRGGCERVEEETRKSCEGQPRSLAKSRKTHAPESPSTAAHAVISLCTATGTCKTRSRIRSAAPASTSARLFDSDEAARLRSVEMAWHCVHNELAGRWRARVGRAHLNLLVLVVRKQVDQGRKEAGLDDRRLVRRVDRDVADACGGGEDEREERGAEEAEERGEAAVLDDFDLVLFCGRGTLMGAESSVREVMAMAKDGIAKERGEAKEGEAGNSCEGKRRREGRIERSASDTHQRPQEANNRPQPTPQVRRPVNAPSDAKFLNANAAWHWTFKLGLSINAIRFTTSLGSLCCNLRRLSASTAMLESAVVQ